MVSKYWEMSPPVSAALRAGCPVVALETGCFCRLAYPQSAQALADMEQAVWQKSCVPCAAAVLSGKLKAGLAPQEADYVLRAAAVCVRGSLAATVAGGKTAAAAPSAALAIARLADIVPVVTPALRDEEGDLDALSRLGRLVFCGPLSEDARVRLAARSIPVTAEADAAADIWLVQRELGGGESVVCECGAALASICSAACEAAMSLKKKTEYT